MILAWLHCTDQIWANSTRSNRVANALASTDNSFVGLMALHPQGFKSERVQNMHLQRKPGSMGRSASDSAPNRRQLCQQSALLMNQEERQTRQLSTLIASKKRRQAPFEFLYEFQRDQRWRFVVRPDE